MSKENLQKLYTKLSELHFLTIEEIDAVVKKASLMTDDGFDELFKTVEEAKKKQDDFILAAIKQDPDFTDNLKRSLSSKYNEITSKITLAEQEKSIKILDQLNNLDDEEK